MKYLNLNPKFKFQNLSDYNLGEVDVDIIRFPSGFESTLRVGNCADFSKEVVITARIEHPDDIFHIGLAADAARREGFKTLKLILPFVPNARQDRSTVKGDSFALKVFANFINSLNFERVCVFDPHSPAVELLINNCVAVPSWELALKALPIEGDILLCAPDAGAVKKTEVTSKMVKRSFVVANKKRLPMTGEIVGLDVYGEVEGKNIYILDDICDGGYTFTILAKQLYELGAEEVHLVVSHGIFSKGLDPLHKANIVSITTTNSFNFDNNVKHDLIVDPNEYVTVVDIRGLLNAYLNN